MSKIEIIQGEELWLKLRQEVAQGFEGALEHLSKKVAALEEKHYTFKEVLNHYEMAQYCDVQTETVLHWIHKEGLPAKKKGRIYYARRCEFENWLLQNPKGSTQKRSDNPGQAGSTESPEDTSA